MNQETIATEANAPSEERETLATQPTTPGKQSPTREERLELINQYQSEAMRRSDPLAANLAVINGDMMAFTNRMREIVDERLNRAPSSSKEYARCRRNIDTYLKCVRQIDRLARIERQLSAPTSE